MKAKNKSLVVVSMLYVEPRIRMHFRKKRQTLENSWHKLYVFSLPQWYLGITLAFAPLFILYYFLDS